MGVKLFRLTTVCSEFVDALIVIDGVQVIGTGAKLVIAEALFIVVGFRETATAMVPLA